MILLVEDEPAVLYITRAYLERIGYSVMTADTAEQALQIARNDELRLQLLLIDVTLPGTLGTILAPQLQQLHPESKVLFLSGAHPEPHGIDPSQFLGKPFTAPELTAKIREVLETEDQEEKEAS